MSEQQCNGVKLLFDACTVPKKKRTSARCGGGATTNGGLGSCGDGVGEGVASGVGGGVGKDVGSGDNTIVFGAGGAVCEVGPGAEGGGWEMGGLAVLPEAGVPPKAGGIDPADGWLLTCMVVAPASAGYC